MPHVYHAGLCGSSAMIMCPKNEVIQVEYPEWQQHIMVCDVYLDWHGIMTQKLKRLKQILDEMVPPFDI